MKLFANTIFSYLFSRMFVVLFAVSLAFSIALIPIYKEKILRTVEMNGKTVANTTIGACSEALYTKDYSFVISYVTNILNKIPDITYVDFISNQGLKLHITAESWSTDNVPATALLSFKNADDFLLEHVKDIDGNDKKDIFVFSEPVDILGLDWGALQLGILDDYYEEIIYSYIRNVFLSSFILLIISVSILFRLSRTIALQLATLREFSVKLSHGDLSSRAPVDAIGEVNLLANTFNEMADSLENKSAEISRLAKLVEDTDDAIIIFTAQQHISFVNSAFCEITDKSPSSFIGMNLADFFTFLGISYTQKRRFDVALPQLIQQGWTTDLSLKDPAGKLLHFTLRIEAFDDLHNAKNGSFIVLNDITERKQLEVELEKLVYIDNLTQLPNRRYFLERTERLLTESPNNGLAVFFLDLDNFKIINDSLGHDAGDAVLVETASRLKNILRSDDLICRLGGDEFTVLLSGVLDKNKLKDLALFIINTIAAPISYKQRQLHIGTSIGIVSYPDDGESVQTLIKNADTAMYAAKHAGKNSYRFYTSEMNNDIKQQLEIETNLRHALTRGEMQLVYQPFVDLATGNIYGCEALIRWQRADGEYTSPALFIPIAEKSNLINLIGEWVFSEVCKQLQRWPFDIKVSINISGNELKEIGFVNRLQDNMQQYDVKAKQIQLEFTEHVLVAKNEHTQKVLNDLRAAGFTLAIDDFGTGFSSLSYIAQLPVDVIKVDRSFVNKLPADDRTVAVVKAITSLGQSLNIRTVAEGVENKQQVDWLFKNGCNSIQGYYFYKPMCADDFAQLVEASQTSHLAKTN